MSLEIFNPKHTLDNIFKKYSVDDIENKPNIILEYLKHKETSKKIRWLYLLNKTSTNKKSKSIYNQELNKIDYIGVLLRN